MMEVNKWEIWQANLEPIVGSEQGKVRPVLVISENYTNHLLNIVNVLPITTRKSNRQIYPNETLISVKQSGLENESIVLCYQIRTIDKIRLIKKYGTVTVAEVQGKIIEALKFQLGIY